LTTVLNCLDRTPSDLLQHAPLLRMDIQVSEGCCRVLSTLDLEPRTRPPSPDKLVFSQSRRLKLSYVTSETAASSLSVGSASTIPTMYSLVQPSHGPQFGASGWCRGTATSMTAPSFLIIFTESRPSRIALFNLGTYSCSLSTCSTPFHSNPKSRCPTNTTYYITSFLALAASASSQEPTRLTRQLVIASVPSSYLQLCLSLVNSSMFGSVVEWLANPDAFNCQRIC